MQSAKKGYRLPAAGYRSKRNGLSLASSRLPVAVMVLLLAACATQRSPKPPAPPPPLSPDEVLRIPEPTPKSEPRSPLGNPAFYEVFGKRYFVLPSSVGYLERGVASWYGPGFHKERTATGDPYDMYAMTAAHKTLPLPCYARVTNLSNGRSVIVHINDRGPFKGDRIIDLSYTAATKLDMVRAGTALVEVQVVSAEGGTVAAAPVPVAPLYIQAGAFTDVSNAERLVTRLKALGYPSASLRKETRASRDIHRVRIGPIANVQEFDRVVGQLKTLGIDDARLAAAD